MAFYSVYDSSSTSGIGEPNLSLIPKGYPRDGSKPGVIALHGAGGNEMSNMNQTAAPKFSAVVAAIANAGFPVLSIYAVGDNWGNDAGLAKVGLGKTFLQGTLGAKAGAIGLIGISMGAATMYSWARANLASVSAMVGAVPVSDVTDIWTNNRGGLTASINAAYAGAYSEATYGAAHNPATFGATLAGKPVQMHYATDDATVLPATVTALATLIGGVDLRPVTGFGGHSDASAGQAPQAVADFFTAHL